MKFSLNENKEEDEKNYEIAKNYLDKKYGNYRIDNPDGSICSVEEDIRGIVDVYNNKAIGIVYFEDKGYVLFEKDNTELNNVFFIKTDTLPAQYLVDNPAPSLANDKENIIDNTIKYILVVLFLKNLL